MRQNRNGVLIPLLISLPGSVQSAPIIVANNGGKAAVIWRQNDDAYISVFTPQSGVWESPTNLGAADEADVCIDENGNITAAILVESPTNVVVSHTRLAGSSTFTAETIYDPSDATLDLRDLEITCTSASGQVLFVWVDTKSGSEKIQSKYRSGGVLDPAAITTATDLPTGANTPNVLSNPIAHMLPDGTTHAVYFLEEPGGDELLYTNVFTPGTGWDTEVPFGITLTSGPFFDFALNSHGNGITVVGTNGVSPSVSYLSGGDWSAIQSMNTGDVNNTANIATTIDNNNIATVIWVDDPSDEVYVRSTSIFSIPTDWDDGLSPVSVNTPNSVVTTSTSGNGNLLVGWLDSTSGNLFRSLFRASDSSDFFSLQTIDSAVVPGSFAATNNGVTFAAWTTFTVDQVRVSIGIDPIESLVKALGKKRLIYQRGIYP